MRSGFAALVLFVALAAVAAASCNPDRDCDAGDRCKSPDSECRPAVVQCADETRAVILTSGQCRDHGAVCSTDSDCVPDEICDTSVPSGVCTPGSRCSGPPPVEPCPAGCIWPGAFPCACVCTTCPAVPDGGSS